MIRYSQVTVDGQPITYAVEGNRTPLLLLHGAPFDHQVWLPVIPYLSGHFRVIAPDLPGWGRSPRNERAADPEGLFRTIAAFMAALQIVPAHVAGAGIGGGIALGVAARYPERVRSVVSVGGVGARWWPETSQARLARSLCRAPGLPDLLLRIAPRAQARWLLRSAVADQLHVTEAAIDQIVPVWRDRGRRSALLHTLRTLDEWAILGRRLGGVRAPTLLIWGERDAWYPLPAAERLRHAIPGARLVTLAGAGHALPLERPVELAETLRTFLLSERT
jgi:pimeloyl-ACP methyl ester carboxylesterase